MTPTRTEQLDWEARAGKPAAAAAALAAVCLIGSTVYLQASIGESADDTNDFLALVDEHSTEFVVSGVINGIGLLLLIPVLGYLYRAIRFRRPEAPRIALVLLLVAPVAAAVLGVWRQAELVAAAGDFVAEGQVTGSGAEERADDVIEDSNLPVVGGVGFAANLALGFAIVLLSLNAMRAGLTSRFMGIIGIIIGVLYVLPVAGGPQIVQLFWLGALAALFSGRWPGGRGPAWESGEAVPWPSAAEQAQRREEQLQEARSDNGRDAGDSPDSADPDVPRPSSRKRKKRRRR